MTLRDAERTDLELREQLNDLVRARARAHREAERLGIRARLPGAQGELADLGSDYRGQAERLGSEVEQVRAALRRHEAELERLRAAQAPGAPASAGTPPAPQGGGAPSAGKPGDAPSAGTPPTGGPGGAPGPD